MFKKIVLPLMLLAAGGFAVALAVSSVPSSTGLSTLRSVNPCGAKTLNPCLAKTLNPCAARTLNTCQAKNPCVAKNP